MSLERSRDSCMVLRHHRASRYTTRGQGSTESSKTSSCRAAISRTVRIPYHSTVIVGSISSTLIQSRNRGLPCKSPQIPVLRRATKWKKRKGSKDKRNNLGMVTSALSALFALFYHEIDPPTLTRHLKPNLTMRTVVIIIRRRDRVGLHLRPDISR